MPFVFIPTEVASSELQLDLEVYHNSTSAAEQTHRHGPDDCPFCHANNPSTPLFDIGQHLEGSEVIIKPALGMMTPGYFLGITTDHITSFAQLEPDQLHVVDSKLTDTEAYLGSFDTFGEYFRVEHGSDNITECGSGGCLDHAHQHLIPAPDVADAVQEALPWQRLGSYEDTSELRGEPYIYFGRSGKHYVVANPALPSQWIRRKIAEVRGMDNWDWATYHGVEELFLTFMAMGRFPRGRSVWDLNNDSADYEPSTGPTLYS